jgi:hypothetical protein
VRTVRSSTVHASGSGDDAIIDQVRARSTRGDDVVVVTAGRGCGGGWRRPAALPSARPGSLLGLRDLSLASATVLTGALPWPGVAQRHTESFRREPASVRGSADART